MRNHLREFLIATSQQGCSENRNGGNMPSTYAHYRMGQEVYRNLTGKPKQIIEKYKELYDIGLHGPDILFYYKPLFANPVNHVGYAMHDRPGIEFFRQASLVMQKAENKEACEAYIYGFCCHFALDVSCHGYIDEKIAESGVSHTEIEVEFDRKLMLTDGFNPLTHNLTGHIHPTLKNAEVISPFYKNVTPQQAEQALQGIITNNKLLIAPSYFKRFLIYGLLKATGNYKEMHGLLVNYSENPQCTDSTQMLMQLYRDAEKLAERLIDEYEDSASGKIPFDKRYGLTFGGKEKDEPLEMCG